jgi:hypothetical protein
LLDQKLAKIKRKRCTPRALKKSAKTHRTVALNGRDVRLSAASFEDFLLFFHSPWRCPQFTQGQRTQPGVI